MPVHGSDLSYLSTHQSDSPHSYHHHQTQSTPVRAPSPEPELTWDPAIDQADRAREARADAADFAHGAALLREAELEFRVRRRYFDPLKRDHSGMRAAVDPPGGRVDSDDELLDTLDP